MVFCLLTRPPEHPEFSEFSTPFLVKFENSLSPFAREATPSGTATLAWGIGAPMSVVLSLSVSLFSTVLFFLRRRSTGLRSFMELRPKCIHPQFHRASGTHMSRVFFSTIKTPFPFTQTLPVCFRQGRASPGRRSSGRRFPRSKIGRAHV